MNTEKIEQLARQIRVRPGAIDAGRILADAADTLERTTAAKASAAKMSLWRTIMNSRITKLAAAAVIIIGVIALASVMNRTIPTASASATQVLTEAAKAVENIQSIHIKAKMRTPAHDNFANIGLTYDFVPVEMWKKVDDAGVVLWRIEKPRRVIVTNADSTTMLIRPNNAVKDKPCPIGSFDTWCGHLMNVGEIIDNALKETMNHSSDQLCMRNEVLKEGTELVIEIESAAQGEYTNDYLKNKFISESDHKKVYHFDAETKLLKGFEVFVHTEKEDVLVFEVTDIEYNPQIDNGLFTLELPADVIWFEEPKNLGDKYQQMTPKQVAQSFFQACADENWDEVLKFWPQSAVSQDLKDYLGGLKVISIGEPFKSGLYPGWFVPYEIKFKNGRVKKMNLAVRNDNPAKQYIVDGGI
jgi:hypothetical protein